MIEFEAPCGHHIRARDEDGGRNVKCSYCGQAAKVPETSGDALDFLLADFEDSAAGADAVQAAPRSRRRRRITPAGTINGFDPFPLIKKLLVVTVVVVIVVVIARMAVIPVITEWRETAARKAKLDKLPPRTRENPNNQQSAQGSGSTGDMKQRLSGEGGLYVTSVPEGTMVYVARAQDTSLVGRVDISRCVAMMSESGVVNAASSGGDFVIDFVIPWNDPRFLNYPGYTEFRRKVEQASSSDANKLLEEYFLPDEAQRVFVHRTDEQIYWVRQFRNVNVTNRSWVWLQPLFLPRLYKKDGSKNFAIDQIVRNYLPEKQVFTFDEEHVRKELEYYEVAPEDRTAVMECLKRIGLIPYYHSASGKVMLFKIDPVRGMFGVRKL